MQTQSRCATKTYIAFAILLGSTTCKQMYLVSPQLQSFSAPFHANKCIWRHCNCNPSRLHDMQTDVFGLTAIAILLGSTTCKQMYLASPQLQSFSAPRQTNRCIWPHRNCNPCRLHGMQTNVLGFTALQSFSVPRHANKCIYVHCSTPPHAIKSVMNDTQMQSQCATKNEEPHPSSRRESRCRLQHIQTNLL